MVPSESLLALPFSVTCAPAVTDWLGPALATGTGLGDGLGELPPPQAESTESDATRVMPDKRVRIPPYTGVAGRRGVRNCRKPAPGTCLAGICARSHGPRYYGWQTPIPREKAIDGLSP